MQAFALSPKLRKRLMTMLAFMLVLRVVTMAIFPLTDTTEARYAEIARRMLETGNWVTPQFDYGVPFWGKPPLSFWASAASMGAFGVNQFAVRLPELLFGLGMMGMVGYLGSRRRNLDFGFFSAVVLLSFPLFFVLVGSVMTDTSLAFSVCLSFVAFWMAGAESDARKRRLWGYAFFVGQGLGLLAKGPVCGVLTFFPIVLWAWSQGKSWRSLWHRLPWIRGTLLTLLIAAPWYLWAEHRTPGFLSYFIVGEHIKRFLVPGWQGDRYGRADVKPFGAIWVYWIADVLPWSLLALAWLLRRLRRRKAPLKLFKDEDGWAMYLVWWSVWPMLFFTLTHNTLWPYVITGLPAFALLLVEMWHRGRLQDSLASALPYRNWLWIPFGVPAAVTLVLSLLVLSPALAKSGKAPKETQMFLMRKYLALRPSPRSRMYYLFVRYYSAEFYTHGQARHTDDPNVIRALLHDHTRDFIAVRVDSLHSVPADVLRHFEKVETMAGVELLEEKAPG